MKCRRTLPSVLLMASITLSLLSQVEAYRTINIVLTPRFYKPPASPPLFLDCPVNPDRMVNIVLSVPNVTLPYSPNLCGVDVAVDPRRLLSEWNGPYIFNFLYKKDSNPKYATQVFKVMTFTSSGKLKTTTTTTSTTTTTAPNSKSTGTSTTNSKDSSILTEDEDTGLFALFIAPPSCDCNSESLEAAASGQEGFYPVFLSSLSSNFSAQKELFLTDVGCLKMEYGGKNPTLCGTKLFMGKERGQSRKATMEQLFNFAYIENRKVRPNTIRQCKSGDSTKESIHKSSFFDTTSPMWFKRENKTVYESDGFAKVEIHRDPNMKKKAVGNLKTSIPQDRNAANDEDFVKYDGPVVFEKDKSSTEVYIGLKKDDIDEEQKEFLTVAIEPLFSKRRKREVPFGRYALINLRLLDSPLYENCDPAGWTTYVFLNGPNDNTVVSVGKHVVKYLVEKQEASKTGWNNRDQGHNDHNPFTDILTYPKPDLIYEVEDGFRPLPKTAHHMIPWPEIGISLYHIKEQIKRIEITNPNHVSILYNNAKNGINQLFGFNLNSIETPTAIEEAKKRYKSATWGTVANQMYDNHCKGDRSLKVAVEDVAYDINRMLRWTPSNMFLGPAGAMRNDPTSQIDLPIYLTLTQADQKRFNLKRKEKKVEVVIPDPKFHPDDTPDDKKTKKAIADDIPDDKKKKKSIDVIELEMPEFDYTPAGWYTIIEQLAMIDEGPAGIPGPTWVETEEEKKQHQGQFFSVYKPVKIKQSTGTICFPDAYSGINEKNCGLLRPFVIVKTGEVRCGGNYEAPSAHPVHFTLCSDSKQNTAEDKK
eukprot:GFUD01009956.1.p1 GENE.GFUD01009956.1~~GFUD01009956.1.p1  ORF type:complete len:815 (+),score=183.03 GFUD01009956.1:105-2549(+)